MEKALLIMVGMFRFYFCDFQDGSHNHLWLWNPSGSAGKESTCNAGDPSSILGFRKIPWRRHRLPTPVFLGFSGGSAGKESTCSVGDLGWIPGLGRFPGGEHGNSFQYSGLENPREQRSLAGCSLWGCREVDMNERLSTHTHLLKV